MTDLLRYWRSARHLAPGQVRHQITTRIRSAFPEARPEAAPVDLEVRSGWHLEVERARGAPQPGALDGRFEFWGRAHPIHLDREWLAPGEGKSWNYPLHYFDHAPAVAGEARRLRDAELRAAFARHLERWIEVHPPGCGVAWEAYPTALRIVNWLDAVQVLGEWAEEAWRRRVLQSVYVQAAWLERHLERHLQGTHLLKDATGLAYAGQVFGGRRGARWRQLAEEIVRTELGRHVRPDGGHVEPSVLYHGIALQDVLDLLNLFQAARNEDEEAAAWRAMLLPVAGSMLAFLEAVRPPGDGWPLLGDAAVDARPNPRELIEYAGRLGIAVPGPGEGLRFLPESQLLVWRSASQYVLADVGGVGPPHLAGHGHCDSLSFEWFVKGEPFVVDSGTQSYEPNAARSASRATRAHNTLVIDGAEQHEIWAAFRVARRSAVHARLEQDQAFIAELVPWFDRRIRVRRGFTFGPHVTRLHDRVEGAGTRSIVSRLHLHPECEARLDGDVLRLRRGTAAAQIRVQARADVQLLGPERSGSVYCASFGKPIPNSELRIEAVGPLPWECRIEMTVEE